MVHINRYCWSCTKQFPTLRLEKNCPQCVEEYRNQKIYVVCNNKECQKMKEPNRYPLCKECYRKVRDLNEKAEIAYYGNLIKIGRI